MSNLQSFTGTKGYLSDEESTTHVVGVVSKEAGAESEAGHNLQTDASLLNVEDEADEDEESIVDDEADEEEGSVVDDEGDEDEEPTASEDVMPAAPGSNNPSAAYAYLPTGPVANSHQFGQPTGYSTIPNTAAIPSAANQYPANQYPGTQYQGVQYPAVQQQAIQHPAVQHPAAMPSAGPQQVVVYPYKSDPMPGNLSLEQICAAYPNHVRNDDVMTRFINEKDQMNASQLAQWIWENMPHGFRGAAWTSKNHRPWNSLEKKIAAVKKGKSAGQLAGPNSAVPITAATSHAGVALPHPVSSVPVSQMSRSDDDDLTELLPLFPGPHAGPQDETSLHYAATGHLTDNAEDAHGSGRDQDTWMRDRVMMLNGLLRAEWRLQLIYLGGLVQAKHADWAQISNQERHNLVRAEWMGRVKRHEEHFAAKKELDSDMLTTEPLSPGHMVARLHELIEMSQALEFLQGYQYLVGVVESWTDSWHREWKSMYV